VALEHDAWIEEVFGIRMAEALAAASASTADGAGDTDGPASGQGRRPRRERAKPVPRAGIGPAQAKRAQALLHKMLAADQKRVSDLLDQAKGPEKAYLTKALASGRTAAELVAFQARIAGKDHAWMENNLHLVGSTHGRGVKQQWESSCVPTTVEAMRGELDPLYALCMNESNPALTRADDTDATRLNPELAADQKRKLVRGGGVATNRDTPGSGMGFDQILADQAGATGLAFTERWVGPSAQGGQTVDQVLGEMDTSLKSGLPVPMRITTPGTKGGHAVLCTGFDKGPPRRYSIHDPWEGKTVIVTEDDIRNDKFTIAGWNHVSHIFQPSPKAGGKAKKRGGKP